MLQLFKQNFTPVDGTYEIGANTDTLDVFSIILATENNDAVVYLKSTECEPEEIGRCVTPTDVQKIDFFINQYNYLFMELVRKFNAANLNEFLESPIDCRFEYYVENINNSAALITVDISCEDGNVYFMVDGNEKVFEGEDGNVYFMVDDKEKVFLGEVEKLNFCLLELYIRKATIHYLIKEVENSNLNK